MRFLSATFSLLFAGFLIFPTQGALAEDPLNHAKDRVAKVGSIVIDQDDVNRRAQKIMPMMGGFHGSVSAEKIAEIKQQALDDLIIRAYKVQYAIDEEVAVDAIAFENEFKKSMRKYKQPVNSAQQAQYEKFRADFYLTMLSQRAEEVAVNNKINVTDEQVASYFAANKKKYYRPKLYTASHIFIRVNPSANAEEKSARLARAEALFKRAQSGEDFYNLAYFESDDRSKYVGGSLGSFHAGQTVAEFDAAIQSMKPGDVVGPVRTIYGYHIIKLDGLEEERQMQFEEVKSKIRDQLFESERQRLYEQWMTELKKKYPLDKFNQ